MQRFIVERDCERIDVCLQELSGLSRSAIKRAIAEGRLYADGQLVKKAAQSVKLNTTLTLEDEKIAFPQPEAMSLDIIYEDDFILVVNKPAGQLVHPTPAESHHTLVNGLLNYCTLSTIAGPNRPGIVHRIDRDTSGLLLIAKNNDVHQLLAKGFKQHIYIRRYIALVDGRVPDRIFTINKPIGRITNHAFKRTVRTDGRSAVTHVEVAECGRDATVVICRLEHGRTHQIRVHLASIHHPLIGDWVYGQARNKFGFKGQALHSWQLVFEHPMTHQSMVFYAPLPTLFQQAVRQIAEE